MNKQIVGMLGFFVILVIYLTLLVALARVLPILFLGVLLLWLILRRPMTHPDRIDKDIDAFAGHVGLAVRKSAELLLSPLNRIV